MDRYRLAGASAIVGYLGSSWQFFFFCFFFFFFFNFLVKKRREGGRGAEVGLKKKWSKKNGG